ncbi:hypothetical protein N7509_006703 [Penicillium cosmopolitanum]|uniref:Uncharacterized protein n=1 Tax=Penicillium cosmopolitanum TaxID=1131564 RepID=A0A9W9VXE7_9EURO|nr:uncharacterized protein N7509_006703 [Penicillium cosmopolitanum]KAJ5391213.1 hypothetical protein N7509_006703 [Penicillium cosmopolitanum]
MTRLTTIFAALFVLSSFPLSLAWTFVWRNATDIATVENGTSAQRCKTIEQAKNKIYKFDAKGSLVRLFLYGSSNCTGDIIDTSEDSLASNSTVPIYGFAVIDLRGANSSSGGELTPFPGNDWFKLSPNSPVITAMGKRLLAENCGKYREGPGPQWSDIDRQSYQCWQEKLGYSDKDADGWPGKASWDQLKVPLTVTSDPESSSTATKTPSSTSASTSNPTGSSAPTTDTSSKSSLSGGEIAGVTVGSVIGVGLIGAVIYLSRRVGRRGALASGDFEPESQSQQRPKSGYSGVDGGVEESKKPSVEHPPTEAGAVSMKKENRHVAELSGDMTVAELSDSRRILEMGDGRK